jgi:SAM-dependent methyltransferase
MYSISEERGRIVIEDSDSGYRLKLTHRDQYIWRVYFKVPLGKGLMTVSGRNMKDYPPECRRIETDLQCLEIGCGLGAFLPYHAKRLIADSPLPIAIDSFDYSIGKRMLRYARRERIVPAVEGRIEKLLERTAVITDQTKVRLLNVPLRRAMRYTSLYRRADVIIDNFGALHWPQAEEGCGGLDEKRERTIDYLARLIHPRGVLLGNGMNPFS